MADPNDRRQVSDPWCALTVESTPADVARLLAEDIAAIGQGRRQIAAGQSHDMDDVIKEMDAIANSPDEKASTGSSPTIPGGRRSGFL